MTLILNDATPVESGDSYYGTVIGGDDYFSGRLNNEPWLESEENNKVSALRSATDLINALNFIDSKTNDTQELQFPRNSETEVPTNIIYATYELAIKLLDGVDPETEILNLAAISQGIDGARTTYNRDFVQDHIMAGIPSINAWRLLRPFLRDPQEIKISRV